MRRTKTAEKRREQQQSLRAAPSVSFFFLSPNSCQSLVTYHFTGNQTRHSAPVSLKLKEVNCQHSVKCFCLNAVHPTRPSYTEFQLSSSLFIFCKRYPTNLQYPFNQKLLKAVSTTVSMEQLGSQSTEFHEI